MVDEIFTVLLFVSCLFFQLWAFKNLPKERWQILASIPVKKNRDGRWSGINLTYYGFFIAIAYSCAIALLILMLKALSISLVVMLFTIIIIGLICITASKIVAVLVEKKRHTFTIGGASFVGMILAPFILLILTNPNMSFIGMEKQMAIPVLSALAISYAFGEGMGRLACISFGCCYGKPLDSCRPFIRKIFRRYAFVFTGKTKKAVYAHGYSNEKLVPVQALTSTIYVFSSICGVYLFLKGHYYISFAGVIVVVQLWRIISEFLRADYRGDNKISVYQIMAVVAIFYAFLSVVFLPEPTDRLPDLKTGVMVFTNPSVLLILNLLWWAVFFIFGKSSVTASEIDLHIVKENI